MFFHTAAKKVTKKYGILYDKIEHLSDSAQAISWYVPEVFASEAFAWHHLGEKAKADSVFMHMSNLYDRRLRQRADFSDAVNRAFVSGCLYGSEAFMAELDSLAKLKAYQPNSAELNNWREFGPEALEQILNRR